MTDEDEGYFSVGEAWDDIKYSYGAKEKTISSLKLLGKGLYNVGRFTLVEVIPKMAEEAVMKSEENAKKADDISRKIESFDSATPEQTVKAKELRDWAEKTRSSIPKQKENAQRIRIFSEKVKSSSKKR